jgi:transposase
LVDGLGNLVRFVLLSGQRDDIKSVDDPPAGIACEAFIGDKAFDVKALRKRLAEHRTEAVIPQREGAAVLCDHDREKHKWRHLVENVFYQIKAFRRIATRYEKTDKRYSAMIHPIGAVPWTQ